MRYVLRILCVTLIWPAVVRADQPKRISAQELKDLAAGVRELVEDDEAVGAEVLVLERRQVVLHEAFGWSDLDRRTPLKPNTIVCVRSMTKPLVGTAIQMLIDDGKLRLSDVASKYLRSFDNDKSRAITIEQLLTHTAGFPLTLIDKPLSSYSGQRAVVDQAGRVGPSGKPGSFRYSDTDSETLAAIVSEVSGQPVDEFIRRRILEPLGMNDTFCVLGKDSPPRSTGQLEPRGHAGDVAQVLGSRSQAVLPVFPGSRRAVLHHDRLCAVSEPLAGSRKGGWAPAALGGCGRTGAQAIPADAHAGKQHTVPDRTEPAQAFLRPALDGVPTTNRPGCEGNFRSSGTAARTGLWRWSSLSEI